MQNLRKIAFLGSVALSAMAMPAFAQQAEGPAIARDRSDEIVVTARKRVENLIDVPVPVSVATAEQLNRDQVRSVTDLQRVTPALEIAPVNGGEVNGGARLRGLGTGVFNATVSPSVAFVVNQVPQGNLTFPILFDLGQVEVLRGPQGTLFGQGASAGVINIATVAPTMNGVHASGGIDFADKGTAGSEVGELTARGAVNIPLGDKAAIRFATQFKRELGLQHNTFTNEDNNIKDLGLRAHLLVKPNDDVTINLIGEYTRQKMHGYNFYENSTVPAGIAGTSAFSLATYLAPTGCNLGSISPAGANYCADNMANMKNTSGGVSAAIDVKLSDSLTLTSVTAFREMTRQTVTVNFSSRIDIAARNDNIQNKSDQFSQELRLAFDSQALHLVVGGLYSRFNYQNLPIDGSIGFGGRAPGQRTGLSVCNAAGTFCIQPASFSYEKTQNTSAALFADATVSLTSKLDLFGGLRYSDYKNNTGTGTNTLVPTNTSRITNSNLSGRVGLSFKPDADTTLFGSYARGYKPPAVVVPALGLPTVLKPELADAFEIGIKRQVGHVQLSANAFYSRVKNFQSQTTFFDSANRLQSLAQNISAVKSKGFEIGAFGRVNDHLTVNAGYQFNIVKYPTPFLGSDGLSLAGTQFLNAPKHKFTLSGEYAQPVSEKLEVFLNANMVWKSSVLLGQYGDPKYRYPSHALVNGGIGVRDADGRWSASVFARNLTKQREPTGYLQGSGPFGGDDGSLRAWPAAGITARVVGISASFNY